MRSDRGPETRLHHNDKKAAEEPDKMEIDSDDAILAVGDHCLVRRTDSTWRKLNSLIISDVYVSH